MRNDLHNWHPLTIEELHTLFSKIPIHWFMAGGSALDIHVGHQTREHADIDVAIYRKDQQVLYHYLKEDWVLYKAQQGVLKHWHEGEHLTCTNDVWVSKRERSPWAFQVMLMDSAAEDWMYRREPSIRLEKTKVFRQTTNGIPYIKPEIQLLYKGGSSKIREKDLQDLINVLPRLDKQEKQWLEASLNKQFPEGHHWLKYF